MVTVKCLLVHQSLNDRSQACLQLTYTEEMCVALYQADFTFYDVYLSIHSVNLQILLMTMISEIQLFMTAHSIKCQLPPLN